MDGACVDCRRDVLLDGSTDGRSMDACGDSMHDWMDGCVHVSMDAVLDGRTDGRMGVLD